MQKDTHLLWGAIAGITGVYISNKYLGNTEIVNSAVLAAGSLAGSLLPDADHTQSTVGRKIPFISYPICWMGMFFKWIGKKTKLKFFSNIGKACSHRGILHSGILYAILLYLSFLIVNPILKMLCIGICIGCFSHLIADTFNPSGIPWLLPLTFKRLSIAKISTGTTAEIVFRIISIIALVILIYLWKGVLI